MSNSLACVVAVSILAFSLAVRAAEDDEESLPVESAASAELERQAALPPPAAASPQELCVFLHKRGLAHLRLGLNDKALADLKEALALKQKGASDLWCDRWRLQIDIKSAIFANADWLVLADYAQSVAGEYRETNKLRYSSTQHWLVDAYVFLGRLRDAEQAFQRSADLLPELRQHKAWPVYGSNRLGQHHTYAAWMQLLRGNYVEAERHRRQALQHAIEYHDYMRAHRSADNVDLRMAIGNVTVRKRQLADVLAVQGKTGEAEILVRQALQETLSRAGKHTQGVARLVNALGLIKQQQGRVEEALRLRRQAVSLLEASGARGYSTMLADMRAMAGFLLGVQNRWAESLEAFRQRDQGLRSNPAQFARTGSNNINWAMALLKNGQTAESERMLRAMIDWNLKKPFVDPLYLAHLRGYHAVALTAAGQDAAALAEYREAFPAILRQAETDSSSENGGFVRQFRLRLIAEGYLELLARMAGKNAAADGELIAEAFRVAEAARGSSVQAAIASSAARAKLPDAALAELARREQDTANQISSLNKLLVRLASAPEGQRLDKAIADIRGEVLRLEDSHAGLRRELAERYPAYAELVAPKAPSPADLQKVLQQGEAAVALYVAERQTYVWTLTPTRVSFRAVDLSSDEAGKMVAKLLGAFDLSEGRLPAYDAATARSLYQTLLAPDEKLWEGAALLNIVPHGALGQLPFAVLLTAASDKTGLAEQAWLVKKIAIAQQPSAGTLISLRGKGRAETKRRPFVGFGDPLFAAQAAGKPSATRSVRNLAVAPARDAPPEDPTAVQALGAAASPEDGKALLLRGFARLPQLPDTAEELNEIGKILGADPKTDVHLGSQATEARVKGNDLSGYGVVAFATHGLVPGELQGLDQPSLAMANPALSGDKDNDGFLTLSEVLGLKLDADWVVLSACNTASGDDRNEEAISGLGRAFFFAGTRRLLLTYWPVETVSARLLTTELFKRQKEQPGESKAEALRHSMLRLMASSKEYAHPAFWAPYGLVGDAAK